MSHPHDDLFADYVDGTLDGADRSSIEAHLEGCATCREEISLAWAAAKALATLSEVDAPADMADMALAEAGVGRTQPAWTKILPVAVAAVIVGLLAISIPRLTQGDSPGAAIPAAVAAGEGGVAPISDRISNILRDGVSLEEQSSAVYDATSVQTLASQSADTYRDSVLPRHAIFAGAASAAPGSGASSSAALRSPAADAAASTALGCVFRQAPQAPGNLLVRLIQADYEGQPAYLAVFLHARKTDGAADRITVYVVATVDCRLVSAIDRPI